MNIEKIATELRKPNPIYIAFSYIGRDILAEASKSQSSIFYVYGPEGMGKTTLALWMMDIAHIYGFTPKYIDAKKITSVTQLKDLLKFSKTGFISWFKMLFKRQHTRILIIVDDAHNVSDKRILNFILKLLDIPFLWVSVCLFSSKPLDEYDYKDILLLKSVYYMTMYKPPKDIIIDILRRRLSALGIKPSIEKLLEIIDKGETMRDIIEEVIENLKQFSIRE